MVSPDVSAVRTRCCVDAVAIFVPWFKMFNLVCSHWVVILCIGSRETSQEIHSEGTVGTNDRYCVTMGHIDLLCLLSASGSEGNSAAWTTEEQKLLEQALKTYPVSTPERWEKIAAAVPGRSKKDCMKRYKVRRCAAPLLFSMVGMLQLTMYFGTTRLSHSQSNRGGHSHVVLRCLIFSQFFVSQCRLNIRNVFVCNVVQLNSTTICFLPTTCGVLTYVFLCLLQELVEMVKAKKAAQEQVAAKSKKWQEPQRIVSVLF